MYMNINLFKFKNRGCMIHILHFTRFTVYYVPSSFASADMLYTFYLLNFPTNKSHRLLKLGNVGTKVLIRGCVSSLALLSSGNVTHTLTTDLHDESSGLLQVNVYLSHAVMWRHASSWVQCWTISVFSADICQIRVCEKIV